jgi:hypothetical protein
MEATHWYSDVILKEERKRVIFKFEGVVSITYLPNWMEQIFISALRVVRSSRMAGWNKKEDQMSGFLKYRGTK